MKRFGLMFAFADMAAVLMEEADGAGGDLPGGADTGADKGAPATTEIPGGDKPTEKKPEPKLEQTREQALDKAGFAATDDPGLNFTLGFLADNAYNADHPAVQAAFDGDFSLLKAELAGKGVKGWEQALALGEQAYERASKANEANAKAVGDTVLAVAEAAGVDWEAAVAHIGGSQPDNVKAALNNLMGDPATAAIAASFITNTYLNADGVEQEPQVKAAGQTHQTQQNGAGGALSRQEYTAAMRDLQKKLGDEYLQSAEAQALYKRLQR